MRLDGGVAPPVLCRAANDEGKITKPGWASGVGFGGGLRGWASGVGFGGGLRNAEGEPATLTFRSIGYKHTTFRAGGH